MLRGNPLLLVGTTLTAFASACGGGGGTNDAGDASTTAQTYTFVVNALTIDPGDSVTDAHTGFNLDGLCSDGMQAADCPPHEDFFSTLDPDQNTQAACGTTCHHGCVDNQLPTLANALMAMVDIRSTIADQISSNHLAILAQVSDVNDLTNDPSVTVSLFVGYPTRTTGCDSIMANTEYVIGSSSLNAGGTGPADAKFHFSGSIVNGRLQVQTTTSDTFNLPLPSVGGVSLTLALHAPQIRANISATGITGGNLGGAVSGTELASTVAQALPQYASFVQPILGALVDIQVGGVCYDMTAPAGMQYGNIGLGLGLTGLPVTIRATTPVVDAPPAGTCGVDTSDGG